MNSPPPPLPRAVAIHSTVLPHICLYLSGRFVPSVVSTVLEAQREGVSRNKQEEAEPGKPVSIIPDQPWEFFFFAGCVVKLAFLTDLLPNNCLRLFSWMCMGDHIGLRCCLGPSWAPEWRVRIPVRARIYACCAAGSDSPCDVSMPLRGLEQLRYHNVWKHCCSLVTQSIAMCAVVIQFVCHKLYYCCYPSRGK
jgi:hypothetical protein